MDVDVKNVTNKAGDEVVPAYLVFPKLPGVRRIAAGDYQVFVGGGQPGTGADAIASR